MKTKQKAVKKHDSKFIKEIFRQLQLFDVMEAEVDGVKYINPQRILSNPNCPPDSIYIIDEKNIGFKPFKK